MLLPIAASSVYLFLNKAEESSIGVLAGGIAGWLITPDVDVDGSTHEEQRWFRINPVLGHLWHCFWYIYGECFKHRGVSHVLFIGTLTRIFYIVIQFTIIQLLWMIFSNSNLVGSDLFFVNLYNSFPYFCHALYFSWSLQDLIHIIFDICSTWLKKRRLLWYSNL